MKAIYLDIVKMGTNIELSIAKMIEALVKQDSALALDIVHFDDFYDDLQRSIENQCVHVIAKRQPVALDLRTLLSVLKIVTDLERIADHCADISEITVELCHFQYIKPLIDIPKMAQKVSEMVKMTVDSYIDQDIQKCRQVIDLDDVVDEYFDQIMQELEEEMKKNPSEIKQCVKFLMVIKYLERMGDHATNIAEWILYSVLGDRVHYESADDESENE